MRRIVLALVLCTFAPACFGGSATPSPPPATTAPQPATPTQTATVTPTATRTTASPTAATPTAAASCPRMQGGSPVSRPLVEVRVAHQPGFDRIVFDFGPAPTGQGGIPAWVVEQATTFVAPSGQAVAVEGGAFLGVRFQGAGQMGSYRGPTSLRPGTPLVHEVRLVEDFEGVLVWGVGLERLTCAQIDQLSAPDRLVLDLPTPP